MFRVLTPASPLPFIVSRFGCELLLLSEPVEPGPPSSQSPSETQSGYPGHVLEHITGVGGGAAPGGNGKGEGGGGVLGGGDGIETRGPQSAQSEP